MNSLPPELLLAVFKFACLTDGTSDILTTIRLSHVSRSWRRLVISSQSLWSNITYYSPFGYHRNYIALQKLMTYLARSGGHPLTLQLHIYSTQDEGFQIICEHSVRWKSLSLKCDHSLVPFISTLLRKTPVPILESLRATAVPSGREHEDSSGPPPSPRGGQRLHWGIFSGGSPRLAFLELGNAAVYYMRPVHLETLTTIHFDSSFNDLELSHSEISTILTIPNLTTLTLLTEFWELIPDISHISPERIPMPKLRYLGIRGQYGSDFEVMRILATLSCPILEVLVLQNVVGTSLDDAPTDIDAREPEVLSNLHTLQLVDSCEISSSLHPILVHTCIALTELIFDTGISESSALGSVLLPVDDDGSLPTQTPIVFPELTTIVVRSIDKRDAQHLITIVPGLREQGKAIERIVLGPEIAGVWAESGHIDGLRDMEVDVYCEDEVNPGAPMWQAPRRRLLK